MINRCALLLAKQIHGALVYQIQRAYPEDWRCNIPQFSMMQFKYNSNQGEQLRIPPRILILRVFRKRHSGCNGYCQKKVENISPKVDRIFWHIP